MVNFGSQIKKSRSFELSVIVIFHFADHCIYCRLPKNTVSSWVLMHVSNSLSNLNHMKVYTSSWGHIWAPGKLIINDTYLCKTTVGLLCLMCTITKYCSTLQRGSWNSLQIHWGSCKDRTNQGGWACNKRIKLLWCWEGQKLFNGSQASWCKAIDQCVWPLWICPRSHSLSLYQQHAPVYWRLCSEGMWNFIVHL